METLQVTKENALKAHKEANDKGKSLLENLFGKKTFQADVTKRVFTVQDACEDTGDDYSTLYDNCKDEYEKAEVSIKVFAKAMRQGQPENKCFYYPYFYGSGGGFSCRGYYNDLVYAFVGSRLRVFTPEQAAHMGKCLVEEYKTYLGRN